MGILGDFFGYGVAPTYRISKPKIKASPYYEYYTWIDKNGIKQELKPKLEYKEQIVKLPKNINDEHAKYLKIGKWIIIKDVDLSKLPSDISYKKIEVAGTYKTLELKTMITPKKVIPCN